jgi:ubiquitin-protein ligase
MLAKRILKELNDWKNDPINNCWLKELEFDKWEATFIGPESSPYAGFLFNVSI